MLKVITSEHNSDVAQKSRLESLLSTGFPANSMLVLASAGFNMDMAVVRVDPVKT